MGKKKIQYDGGHYSRGPYHKDQLRPPSAGPGEYGGLERHALYESAVQSPQGDISYLLRFYKLYVGMRVPEHLREDFCGTALISATWCRGDVRRTAIGLDIDHQALQWGLSHHGDGLTEDPRPRLSLFQGDVREPLDAGQLVTPPSAPTDAAEAVARMTVTAKVDEEANGSSSGGGAQEASAAEVQHGSESEDDGEEAEGSGSCAAKPVDISCALNFSVCLLHLRSDVVRYFRHARQAMNPQGGIFVMDLLGGHAAESTVSTPRHNEITGAHFVWEQEGYNPCTRHIRCYIHLRDPATRKMLRRAFRYDWRLWTIPELAEMLEEAGFDGMRAWLRPMKEGPDDDSEGGSCSSESSEDGEADFVEYTSKAFDSRQMDMLSKGWTAFIVGIVAP